MVGTVFLVILTYAILVSTYNHSFISTIITWVSESKLELIWLLLVLFLQLVVYFILTYIILLLVFIHL